MKKTVLVVVPPERFDFYDYLSRAENCEFILLWHTHSSQMNFPLDQLPVKFKKVIFWGDYLTPQKLLKSICPDRIILFEIIDLRQIPLIVAAGKLNITTFYLEHGAAGDKETAIERWKEITFTGHKIPYFIKRLRYSFADILRSKFFYYSVTQGFNSLRSYLKYLVVPLKMLFNAPNKVLANSIFRERIPKYSIVFNEPNFEEYAVYTGISRNEAIFSGVPFFDKYFSTNPKEENHIIYIEQPYLEANLLNWTAEHHKKIATAFSDFAIQNNTKVYIKLHPRSDASLWHGYGFDKQFVEVIQQGDYTDLFLSSRLILGHSSTLMTAFLCARKNVVLVGWHPEPQVFGTDFSKTGLCYLSFSPDDLKSKYQEWVRHNLAQENENTYQEFLKKFNYPFDGKATERVIQVITANEVS